MHLNFNLTCMKELLIGESLNKQGGNVSIRRDVGSAAAVTLKTVGN